MGNNSYSVVGVMSGTSLDGLDLALCKFKIMKGIWKYRIERAVTIPYNTKWKNRLENAHTLGAFELITLHREYGRFIGQAVNSFLDNKREADMVASHGHTVFHDPGRGITFQIGDGASLAAVCGITTIADFRSLDVAMGGQGAPLVPAGDGMLFGNYDFCLNLGGFSNISYNDGMRRLAFDICPVNIVLNHLAHGKGMEYDAEGSIGRSGRPDKKTLELLSNLPYYKLSGPKSLGREWVEQCFLPVLEGSGLDTADKLRTVYEHIFEQFAQVIQRRENPSVLVTGGGAFNTFLLEGLAGAGARLEIPDDLIIKYKEALIFGFLGLLRIRNEINCLATVTGAYADSSSGAVYHIKRNG